jgi:hypothetical protein
LAVDVAVLVVATAATIVRLASSSRSLHIAHGSEVAQTDTYHVVYHLNAWFFAAVAVAAIILGGLLLRRLRSSRRAPDRE